LHRNFPMKCLTGILVCLVLCSAPLSAQTIAFISDLNGRYGNPDYDQRVTDAVQKILEVKPDLVICTGDMVAGQRRPILGVDQLDRMWRGFNKVVTDPLAAAGIPLLVTPGNHDGSAFPEFATEQQKFARQWNQHRPALDMLPGSQWPRRYAVLNEGVLYVAFDGTRPGSLPGEELEFVAGMLEQWAGKAAKIVVFSHLPMWPLATGREYEIIDDPALLQLLHAHQVSVYASGHHHVFFPGKDGAGMIHLAVGALGGNARAFSGQPEAQDYSFGVLEISSGQLAVRAFPAPGFTESVPVARLPEYVDGPLGRLTRFQ
jgi:hypothetical protein